MRADLDRTDAKEAQEQCYDNVRVSKNAWDTNLVKVREVRNMDRHRAELGDRQIRSTSR
jgi:hypothetical protein